MPIILKIVLSLILAVAVGGVAVYNWGDGYFVFDSKASAERAIEETRAVQTAIGIYATAYGDGEVDFGDVNEGEEPFLYLKEKDLLRESVGNSTNLIEEWIVDVEEGEIEGILTDEEVCRHINNLKHQRALSEPTPACDTSEAESLTCCERVEETELPLS